MKNFSLIILSSFFIVCCFSKSVEAIETESVKVNDTIIKTDIDTSKVYTVVEVMPGFPGGEAEMHRFIAENFKYPRIAMESGIQGRTTVRFVITKKGNISNIECIRGESIMCDSFISIIKRMPRWTPGKQDGKEVDVYFTLPIMIRPKQ